MPERIPHMIDPSLRLAAAPAESCRKNGLKATAKMKRFPRPGRFFAVVLAGAVFSLLGVASLFAESPRLEKNIGRDWTFNYFPQPEPDLASAAPDYNDAPWPAVALPHTWSTYETTRELHPFVRSPSERDDSYWWYGWGWYRKKFSLEARHAQRLVFLEFDGVQKYAKIYVNGALAGEHKGGHTSFSLDITRHVKFDGSPNVVAVQVSNRRDDPFGTIPPGKAGNYSLYGGIYRDVRLVLTDRLHVPFQGSAEHEGGTFVTTPEVSAERGSVRVRTWVRNDFAGPRSATLVTTVRDATGGVVLAATDKATLVSGELHEFDQNLGNVARPQLWSPDHPYLYHVATEVHEGERIADTFTSPLGFRWFAWNHAEKRMYLNGQKILLRGTNRHPEYPWLGGAMPRWLHRRDLEDIRFNLGLNFQRTVHYPNDPFVYDECDRLGFMLIEEAPNIKDIAFGRDIQERNLREMIRRDRNHPSILIWSIGNETNHPADSAWAFAEDPTRIIYLRRGNNGGEHVQLTDKDLPIEELLRCTVRGWLNGDDHDFGAEGPQPAGEQVTGTEEWQHEKVRAYPDLITGNVVTWLYSDHGADREYLNAPLKHINPKGWTDPYRVPKLAYHLFQANYTTTPMAFIHPTWWRPQYIGQRHEIRVDSNCDEVELKLDGVSLGRRTPTLANAHSVLFENVDVCRGRLTVTGWKNGKPAATAERAMAGSPARLVLTTAQREIFADRAGVAIIMADVVDAAGTHVAGVNLPLTWNVTGPARLVGPERYETDTAKNGAMEGAMYIDAPIANVVRATAVPGEIRVRVTAPGLPSAEIMLHSIPPSDERVAGVTEPALSDAGRKPATRDPNFKAEIVGANANKVAEIDQDFDFKAPSRAEYRTQIRRFVRQRNPELDIYRTECRAFTERITTIVFERGGHLVADDYNFNARQLNDLLAPKTK
jgi:hypothetical protein